MDYLDTALEETEESTEEVETEAAEAVEETEQPEEEAPTREQIAQEWLKEQGIEEFDAKKVRNLSKWEKDVQERSTLAGAALKALEEQPKAAVADDDIPDEEMEQFNKYLKKAGLDPAETKAIIAQQKEALDYARVATVQRFAKDNGIDDPSEVLQQVQRMGNNLETIAPHVLEEALGEANSVIRAKSLDPVKYEAEVRAKIMAELADKGVKPSELVEVKKGRGAAAGAHRNVDDRLDDPSISMFDKLAALQDG